MTAPSDGEVTPPEHHPQDGGDADPATAARTRLPDPAEGRSADLAVMRARLAAMAAPREDDDAEAAALRAALRDQRLMAQVMATVEEWPPLEEEQLAILAALLTPRPRPPT